MQRIKKVAVGTKPKYYYLHREDSITGKAYRPKVFDIIDGYTKNYEVVKEKFPSLTQEAECLWIWSRFIVLDKMLLQEDYKKLEGYQDLKTLYSRAYPDNPAKSIFSAKEKDFICCIVRKYGLVQEDGIHE